MALVGAAMNVIPRSALVLATREQILAQVFTLLQAIDPTIPAFRNRGDIEDIGRPAIILLDGSEHVITPEQEAGKTVRMRPALIQMSPQIFVLLKERDTAQNNTINNVAAPVGAELSFWIDAIRGALASDPTLVGMLTSTGQVIFRGAWTDMMTGGTMIGELRMFIDLIYPWLPPA
jgi:hypothetical protein